MPSAAALDYRKFGLKEYKAEKWEAAVSAFDKAIMLGDHRLATYDCKISAMSKSDGEKQDRALAAVQSLITKKLAKDPEIWKLHYRKAKILRKMKSYQQAIQAIDEAVKLVDRAPRSTRDQARDLLALLRTQVTVEHNTLQRRKARKEVSEAESRAAEAGRRQRTIERCRTNFYASMLPPDVLMNICDIGSSFNHDFVVKMGSVCGFWRKSVKKQKSLWGTLVLGAKRPDEKARAWRQLSGGMISTLIFARNYDTTRDDAVVNALSDVLRYNDTEESSDQSEFNIWGRDPSASPEKPKASKILPQITQYLRHLEVHAETSALVVWQEKCQMLHSITLTVPPPALSAYARGPDHSLDLQLCRSTSPPSLRRLDYDTGWFGAWDDRRHLYSRVTSLRLKGVRLFIRPEGPDFLKQVPALKHLDMETCDWASFQSRSQSNGMNTSAPFVKPKLESLVSYTYSRSRLAGSGFFHAPNLTALSIFGGVNDATVHLNDDDFNLSKLTSLDLGKCDITSPRFSAILSQLTSLKFLNVSGCGLKDDFLASISHKDTLDVEDQLLPSLEALSIAHSEISTLAIRDFVNSRLPADRRMVIIREAPKKFAKSASAFRPSTAKRPTATALPATSSGSAARAGQASTSPQSKTASSQLLEGINETFFSTQFTRVPRARPQISWLCVDGCERLNPDLIPVLKKHVKYVSWWMGTPNEERQRGLGRWRWDEGCESCIDESAGSCYMRQREGKWIVQHTCEKKEVPEEEQDGEREKGWHCETKGGATQSS